tara:strand:+ start:5988 stop:6092 length:105 start_codon:yes stop_codon:yes gene_type:complete
MVFALLVSTSALFANAKLRIVFFTPKDVSSHPKM